MALAACGGVTSVPTGTARISLTDAPGDEIAFDNVLITVKAVWFHTSDAAGEGDSGWLRYTLASPRTVDLARLTDGAISQVLNRTLPVGHYQQIRIILAATEDNTYLSPYNNEAIVGGIPYALRVPAADHGIRLAGSFQVTDGGTLNLAIDFDIGHDVVPFRNFWNGNREFLLKPRLRYFDLDRVGSITGKIDAATRAAGYFFVFKAEQLEAGAGKDNTYHVRRFTTTGYLGDNTAFRLSFLEPGTYDVVMRGRNVDTVIVRGVTVASGADTDLGAAINMPAGSGEFFANTRVSPTGSWVNFYQTLDNNAAGTAVEYPYEIRFRHVCPLTGIFFDNVALSNGKLHLRSYSAGTTTLVAADVTPQEWAGGGGNARFGAVADAFLFDRSACVVFDNTAPGPLPGIPGPAFDARLSVSAPAIPATASGVIFSLHNRSMTLDNVYLLAVHGGRFVDSFMPTATSGPMTWTMSGGIMQAPYAFPPLPGNIPGAVYGIDGLGWSPGPPNGPAFAVGTTPAIADLRAGDDTAANFTMKRLFP